MEVLLTDLESLSMHVLTIDVFECRFCVVLIVEVYECVLAL